MVKVATPYNKSWAGATGSEFRSKRDPARSLGTAAARSTQMFDGWEANMIHKLKIPLAFVAGLILGAVVTLVILGKANQHLWARTVAVGTMEQAFIATELRSQRQDDLQKRAEANLVPAVLAIHQHKELQSVPESHAALVAVKDYYEMNGVPIPPEIAGILSTIPSRAR